MMRVKSLAESLKMFINIKQPHIIIAIITIYVCIVDLWLRAVPYKCILYVSN